MTRARQSEHQGEQPALFNLMPPKVPSMPVRRECLKPIRGANDLRKKKALNAHLLEGLNVVRPYDIPALEPCSASPQRLIPFSEARRPRTDPSGRWIHFYEDDYKFQAVWTNPEKYLSLFKRFEGLITPDFSTYRNLPRAERIHSIYKNQLIGAWAQRNGVKVIPNVRVEGNQALPYLGCVAGMREPA